MYIHLRQLTSLMHLLKNIPKRTPKRNEIIKTEFKHLNEGGSSIKVDINTGNKFAIEDFNIEEDQHYKCIVMLIEQNPGVNCYTRNCTCDTTKTLKVFLPEQVDCCQEPLTISREGICGKYFAENKTRPCKVFQSTCKICSTIYYPGYSESICDEQVNRIYTILSSESVSFALTTQSVFSLEFLRSITDQVTISAVRFEHVAKVYNRRIAKQDALDPTILLDSWIVYNIVKRLPGLSLKVSRKNNRNLDVEELAKEAFPLMDRQINTIWKVHHCREKGCFNRAVVIDANEKNHRMKCAYNSKCVTEVHGAPNFFSGCINNPLRSEQGGDDKKEKTRYCKEHETAEKRETNKKTSEQADIRPMTRIFVKKLREENPELIDLAEGGVNHPSGCRGDGKITTFYDRTAGMIWLVRPCLVRLGRWEMFSSESLSQWAICLVDAFGEDPFLESLIKYILGDRVCAFSPYLRNLSKLGNTVFEKYSQLNYILDTFHGDGHVKAECLNDPETGIYNSRLPKWEHMKGCNYEAAEQTFRFINRFKGTTNYMTYSKRLCFFCIVDDEYNAYIEECMMKPDKNGKYKIGNVFFDECPLLTKASDQPWRNL